MDANQKVPWTASAASPLRPPSSEVESWRRTRLLEVGFDLALAAHVAADPRVDLHSLLQLLDRGCPPSLAARILEPLPAALEQSVAPWQP